MEYELTYQYKLPKRWWNKWLRIPRKWIYHKETISKLNPITIKNVFAPINITNIIVKEIKP